MSYIVRQDNQTETWALIGEVYVHVLIQGAGCDEDKRRNNLYELG